MEAPGGYLEGMFPSSEALVELIMYRQDFMWPEEVLIYEKLENMKVVVHINQS